MEPIVRLKSEFFVAYDYGMGGAWGIAIADDEDQIRRELPELQVHEDRPQWMTDDIYEALRRNSRFVVNEKESYPTWLKLIISNRTGLRGVQ